MHSVAFCLDQPVHLSVRDKSEHCKNGEIMYGYYWDSIGHYHWATQGTHLQPPYDHPFLQSGSSQLPVKTCITNCDARYTGGCIDSLWEYTIALIKSTIVDP